MARYGQEAEYETPDIGVNLEEMLDRYLYWDAESGIRFEEGQTWEDEYGKGAYRLGEETTRLKDEFLNRIKSFDQSVQGKNLQTHTDIFNNQLKQADIKLDKALQYGREIRDKNDLISSKQGFKSGEGGDRYQYSNEDITCLLYTSPSPRDS